VSYFTVSSQHSHINRLSKTSSLTFWQVKLHLNSRKDETHILNFYRPCNQIGQWNDNLNENVSFRFWKCPPGSEGRNKIELVTRSPNCAAPLSSKLLVSNGSNSLSPLTQQLIRPDSLSLQNNLNFLKQTNSKANQASSTTCSKGDFHSTALAPVTLQGHAIKVSQLAKHIPQWLQRIIDVWYLQYTCNVEFQTGWKLVNKGNER